MHTRRVAADKDAADSFANDLIQCLATSGFKIVGPDGSILKLAIESSRDGPCVTALPISLEPSDEKISRKRRPCNTTTPKETEELDEIPLHEEHSEESNEQQMGSSPANRSQRLGSSPANRSQPKTKKKKGCYMCCR